MSNGASAVSTLGCDRESARQRMARTRNTAQRRNLPLLRHQLSSSGREHRPRSPTHRKAAGRSHGAVQLPLVAEKEQGVQHVQMISQAVEVPEAVECSKVQDNTVGGVHEHVLLQNSESRWASSERLSTLPIPTDVRILSGLTKTTQGCRSSGQRRQRKLLNARHSLDTQDDQAMVVSQKSGNQVFLPRGPYWPIDTWKAWDPHTGNSWKDWTPQEPGKILARLEVGDTVADMTQRLKTGQDINICTASPGPPDSLHGSASDRDEIQFENPTAGFDSTYEASEIMEAINGQETRDDYDQCDLQDLRSGTESASSSPRSPQSAKTFVDLDYSKSPGNRPYPPLPVPSSVEVDVDGWSVGGIRFAPLRIPPFRRLQTAAVLAHGLAIALALPIFFFLCAIPLMWPLLVVYLVAMTLSTPHLDGRLRQRSEYVRSLPMWRLFARYFPVRLYKTCELSPRRKYIFGYHPHGIASHGAWAAFATNALGFSSLFPGITNTLLTLDVNFRIPLYRNWLLMHGVASVSREAIVNILSKGGPDGAGAGRAVTIVIGGARESLEARPGTLRLVLQVRKGFVKMAIRTGADLVPVLCFGENEVYDQVRPETHPLFHRVQILILRLFRFTLPGFHGRGLLNYDVGLMPYRHPLHIVVGQPLAVATGSVPVGSPTVVDQTEVDRVHALYLNELQRMWDAYKGQFAPNRVGELEFVD